QITPDPNAFGVLGAGIPNTEFHLGIGNGNRYVATLRDPNNPTSDAYQCLPVWYKLQALVGDYRLGPLDWRLETYYSPEPTEEQEIGLETGTFNPSPGVPTMYKMVKYTVARFFGPVYNNGFGAFNCIVDEDYNVLYFLTNPLKGGGVSDIRVV